MKKSSIDDESQAMELQLCKRSPILAELYAVCRNDVGGDLLHKYELDSDTWEDVATVSKTSIYNAGYVGVDTQLIIAGGWRDKYVDRQFELFVQSINVYTGKRKDLKPLNSPRICMTAIYLNDNIFICGGMDDDENELNTVDK